MSEINPGSVGQPAGRSGVPKILVVILIVLAACCCLSALCATTYGVVQGMINGIQTPVYLPTEYTDFMATMEADMGTIPE